MSASCLFLGAAVHPQYVKDNEREKQWRMVSAVQSDIESMFNFAASHSDKQYRRRGRPNYIHDVQVSGVLLNQNLYDELEDPIAQGQRQKQGANQSLYEKMDDRNRFQPYTNLKQVRDSIQNFLAGEEEDYSPDNLILFMTGHGGQHKPGRVVEEYFCLPKPGLSANHSAVYTDTMLTEDITEYLPAEKTLYLIIHSCHSGGMVNFWKLDPENEKVALFASAEADIWAEWNADDTPSFVQSFCKHAEIGKQLCSIAGDIYQELYSVPKIRPAFKTTKPEMATDPFLE
ncbi:uncharacterized protein LOC135808572 [Sycon ciliatum]|uniref:uncharacterized protein LOC135808572 n=1 Tax=Sycon ciliatum TaxID=27933 RepID=UPI0031F665F6